MDPHALSKDFGVNMELSCDEVVDVDTVLKDSSTFGFYLDSNPCASATALLTYLIIGEFEIPRDPAAQEEMISRISTQQIINFHEVLQSEIISIQDKCKTQDLDIVFVLDASGSITQAKWDEATDIIATDWIEKTIKPSFRPIGNHVAARIFASTTERVIEFQDERFTKSGSANYTKFVADTMRSISYTSGGTDTAGALKHVRETDLATSRDLGQNKTIVCVFTDGASNVNPTATITTANELKEHATIYSVGIGVTLNEQELVAIASDPSKSYQLSNFAMIRPLMQSIMNDESVCGSFDCRNIFRSAKLEEMGTNGASQLTGEGAFYIFYLFPFYNLYLCRSAVWIWMYGSESEIGNGPKRWPTRLY